MAPRKGTKKPAYEGLTLEMLEKLKTQAILMEDRINIMARSAWIKTANCATLN